MAIDSSEKSSRVSTLGRDVSSSARSPVELSSTTARIFEMAHSLFRDRQNEISYKSKIAQRIDSGVINPAVSRAFSLTPLHGDYPLSDLSSKASIAAAIPLTVIMSIVLYVILSALVPYLPL